jgi:ATP-dependent RNA helicase RhlE
VNINPSRFINKAVVNAAPAPAYVPKHAFADFAIDARLKAAVTAKKYVTPTPIQDQAIPHVLAGKDTVGIANTGTGKTAAFLVPLIDKVLKKPLEKVIIMVPTRELAQQIEDEFRGFTRGMTLRAVCAVGGASIVAQMKSLSYRPNFVIGTPGRLRDLIDRNRLNLAEYATVVLDEADRMLDMGFINEVKFMLAKMPAQRHTLFFSATMSPEIQALIKDFLKDPAMVSVKTGETAAGIDQDIIRVPAGADKVEVLCSLLRQPGFDKVLVFGRTKHGVERLAKTISAKGFKAESIHGNKSQPQRQKALKLFKDHQVQVLAATDVAARGLDIVGVSHVINYDLPASYDDYIHRIGRTGRAGLKGKALTFV